MRQRRSGRRHGPPLELIGPRIAGRDDAVAALCLSAAGEAPESVVVLVCDHDLRVVLATEFEGAPAAGVATAVGLVVAAVPPESRLVVGILRGEQAGAPLDRLELEAVEHATRGCERHGVALVDVLVLGRPRSGPVEAVGGTGYGVDDSDR